MARGRLIARLLEEARAMKTAPKIPPEPPPERIVYVTCPKCGQQYDEHRVKIFDICEDFFGRDVVMFHCPFPCDADVESLRIAK